MKLSEIAQQLLLQAADYDDDLGDDWCMWESDGEIKIK